MARYCAGCRAYFASVEAFELHATGQPRPARDAPRRCRTADQMRDLGMGRIPGSRNWSAYYPAKPKRRRAAPGLMTTSPRGHKCHFCGEAFNSATAFTAHRVGQFGQAPGHALARRCRNVAEMQQAGLVLNDAGLWMTQGPGRESTDRPEIGRWLRKSKPKGV